MKEKKNVLATIGNKAKDLLAPNDKDVQKIHKKAEQFKRNYEVYDLAARFLENPEDEGIKKEVLDLDEVSGKLFTSIMEKKKKFVMVAAGALTLITVGAVVAGKTSKKHQIIDADYEEIEEDDEDEELEVDEIEDEEDAPSESTEE